MTNTPTDEAEVVAEEPGASVPAAPAESTPTVVVEPIPFWHRRYVERFLIPLVLPVLVILFVVAYILNISRLFLAGHGHISIFVGSFILLAILIGATVLSAVSPRLNKSTLTLVSALFVFAIMSGGWLVLGHAQPEKAGPTTLPPTLKTKQTIQVVAAPGGNLKFTPDALTATTGLATIKVAIAAPGHTFNMRDSDTLWQSLSLDTAGTTKSGVAFFPTPGTYGFFCAVPGHDAAGMHGTITVTGPPKTLTQALVEAGNLPSAAG